MRSKERTPFTPVDLCGLIAHETASMLYGVGADSIPSAETMRAGLETFAAAAGALRNSKLSERDKFSFVYFPPAGAYSTEILFSQNQVSLQSFLKEK